MNAPLQNPGRMAAEEFLLWAERQPSGRYELYDGEVVAMAPERASHAQLKLQMTVSLLRAVHEAGISCQVFPDGMAVKLPDDTVFEPDAMVRCGQPIDRNAVAVTDPVIVVEVLSPSTWGIDTTVKLERYFQILSVQHYLIARTDSPVVVHHRRTADGIATRIVQPGPLRLDPPGLTLELGNA